MKRCARGHLYQAVGWQCPNCGEHPAQLDGFVSFAPADARASDGFAEEYFAHLARFESGHFWFESRNRLLIWALHRYFPQAAEFLEIGCGTGFVLSALRRSFPGIRLSGSEMFVEALRFAATRAPDLALFQMDARRIPFESEFDVIGAFDVLEHIEEDEAVLGQMRAALRPGGGILVTVPQHPFLWSAVDDYSFHKRRYRRRELIHKVRAAGFKVLHVTSFVTVLLPLMLASRLRRRTRPVDFDPYAEFKVAPALNQMLTWALDLERFLIRTTLSLPVGGSLLLIAQRDS
jgi:SAM-dependent methyltransferase